MAGAVDQATVERITREEDHGGRVARHAPAHHSAWVMRWVNEGERGWGGGPKAARRGERQGERRTAMQRSDP
jgi:hypothetical protein